MQVGDEAGTLLQQMAARYAELESYRDAGVVRTNGGGGEAVLLVRFRTEFVRTPAAFRFDFAKADMQGFVSRVSEVVRSQYVPELGTAAADDLMTAIAGATGLSLGAAQTIPALLLPEEATDQWTLLALQGPQIVPPPGDRAPAWRWIAGRAWDGQVLRVGLDPRTLLVRRVEDEGSTRVPPSVTEYDAEANPVVASETLMSDTPARL